MIKYVISLVDMYLLPLVYCRSGARAAHIAGLLTRHEFEQVYNLKVSSIS
jgi:protein tyrosine phosphatase (PTP) superfamily phosphohydrolase (DUF442 family)